MDEIHQAFDLFDTNGTGKIDPKELKSKNPAIFQLIADLDTPQANKQGGIDFDSFVEAINNKVSDKETKEGIRRIFTYSLMILIAILLHSTVSKRFPGN